MPIRITIRLFSLALLAGLVSGLAPAYASSPGQAQPGCRTFPETNHTVCGRFLEYWTTHGGLAQQGYPLSDEFQEKSALDGKTYTVQYFERAVFELHPENLPPFDVLLSQLGKFQYMRKHGAPPTATPGTAATP